MSVHMEALGSHRTDFYEILYCGFLLKLAEKVKNVESSVEKREEDYGGIKKVM
jgi:hypothetical protein